MRDRRRHPGFAALLALSVALGAILASEPFDAWTSVSVDQHAPPTGEHALLPRLAPSSSPGAPLRTSQRLLIAIFAVALAMAAGDRRRRPINDLGVARHARWLTVGSPDRAPPILAR